VLTVGIACAATTACGPGQLDLQERRPTLLVVDEDEGTIDRLLRIDLAEGRDDARVEVLCEDLELPADMPADTNFTALALRGSELYASASRETWGDTLVRIDPCACTVVEIGSYGFEGVSGLASGGEDGLVGVAAIADALVTIDPSSANAETMSPLATDWDSVALSGGPTAGELYALDSGSDLLTVFDEAGTQLDSVPLTTDFQTAGLEYHPDHDRLFACGVSEDRVGLYAIDPTSGQVELVASDLFTTACDNMALAPAYDTCVE
jgi:hypothetical protein